MQLARHQVPDDGSVAGPVAGEEASHLNPGAKVASRCAKLLAAGRGREDPELAAASPSETSHSLGRDNGSPSHPAPAAGPPSQWPVVFNATTAWTGVSQICQPPALDLSQHL